MILDTHCHVIPAGMLTGAVPDDWRPAVSIQDGRQIVSFRGRRLNSVTGEFADVAVMLDQAAATGVSHLLLSPWVMLQLVVAGVLDRFPRLLAHGGGALLALRGRLRRAFSVRPEARADGVAEPDRTLRLLYYDSLTHDQMLLRDLVRFAGPQHVLLGSDRPFDMGADKPADDISSLGLSGADEQLLLGGNAARLLSLLAD